MPRIPASGEADERAADPVAGVLLALEPGLRQQAELDPVPEIHPAQVRGKRGVSCVFRLATAPAGTRLSGRAALGWAS